MGMLNKMNITKDNILFGLKNMSQNQAIEVIGKKMMELGFCEQEYIDSMKEKCLHEQTYIGNGISIPHGRDEARRFVLKTGIVIGHFSKSIQYDGEETNLIIGIASNSNEHIEILQELAIKLFDENYVKKLVEARDINDFYMIFNEN